MASRSLVNVSVIMAARNVAPYIDEAIRSVLAQQGVPFELLIGDDASTDETWARIRSYQSDARVRAWRFRTHRRPAGVRNRLIHFARGKYLAICDADDAFLPNHLRVLCGALDRHPRMGAAFGDYQPITSQGKYLTRPWSFPGTTQAWDIAGNVVPHGGTVIRRRVMKKIGGYREQWHVAEDYDLFLRLAEMTHFYHIPKPFYLCRLKSRQATQRTQRLLRQAAEKIRREAIRRRHGVSVSW